jgi:plasmid stabilization system protein ParE
LRAIHDYIARDSKLYAKRMVARLKHATDRLKTFPLSGGMVPEWQDPELREVICGAYRIIYRPEAKRVVVLTVIHGARLLPAVPP